MIDYIHDFIDVKAVEYGASLNTLHSYETDISLYIREISPLSVEKVTKEDIENYLNKISDNGFSSKTIARKISVIKEFYKFLKSENVILENPALNIKTPKQTKSLPDFLEQEDVEKILGVLSGKNDFSTLRAKIIIKLMSTSGLRVSEVVSLPEKSINLDSKNVVILGKGSKERIVPITNELAEEVKQYIQVRNAYLGKIKSKWLFPSIKSLSGHITRDAIFKKLKKITMLSGISSSNVHPHTLRHSFATKLINKDVDLRSIQKMLGHENISTTEIYTHITTNKPTKEVKKHHPLAKKTQ